MRSPCNTRVLVVYMHEYTRTGSVVGGLLQQRPLVVARVLVQWRCPSKSRRAIISHSRGVGRGAARSDQSGAYGVRPELLL